MIIGAMNNERKQGQSIHLSPRPNQSVLEPLPAKTRGAPRKNKASTRRYPSAFERRVPPSLPQSQLLHQSQGQTLSEILRHLNTSVTVSIPTSTPAANPVTTSVSMSVPTPTPISSPNPSHLSSPASVTVSVTMAPSQQPACQVDDDEESNKTYRADNIGNATRLLDVLRSTIASQQITAGSNEISAMVQKLHRFQATALCSTDDLHATIVPERGERTLCVPGQPYSGAEIPSQNHLRQIKSQQKSLSKEREMMIRGIQTQLDINTTSHSATVYSVLNGSGDQNVDIMATDSETLVQLQGTALSASAPSMDIRFGPSTSFSEAGRQLAESFTLNRRQSIALRLICGHLDRVCRDEQGTPQLCQFIGGEGGTGKSRIIDAITELFATKGISHRLLV